MSYRYDTPTGNQQADLIYKALGDREIMLTFLPPLQPVYEKAPVYLIIPGGGWHHETRQSMIDFSAPSVEALRNQGYATVSIDYRVVSEPNVVMRNLVNDCFDALRYLVHFADIFQIDPHRITVSGHSAGGHLALMLAYAPQEAFRDEAIFDEPYTVTAAAPMSPPTVLYLPGYHGLGDLANRFQGCNTKEERMATSPDTYITSKCPPTLLMAGTSDHLVYSKSSEVVYDKLVEAGVEAQLVLSVCGGHCFEQIHPTLYPSPNMDDMQKLITNFILRHA
jgi:acetyl esterase/lipase